MGIGALGRRVYSSSHPRGSRIQGNQLELGNSRQKQWRGNMSSTSYDIITIGGGLAGAALAKVMAERGARVLVLESETRFRDRVRGEVMVNWGVAEAKELGVYETIKAAGGRDIEWAEMALGANKPDRRHMRTTTIPGTPRLHFYHPDIQEALLEAASNAGALVHRGARVRGLQLDDFPKVVATVNGVEQEFSARLVVGADGRASGTRTWGTFDVCRKPASTFCAGTLLDDMAAAPDDTSHLFRGFSGLSSLLFPQGSGRVRAYVCYPTVWEQRLSGSSDIQQFIDWSVDAGAPAEFFQGAIQAGPLASFDSATTWVEHPYRDHVVLIGDAAATTDPIWGQGLSFIMRDVRVLRDQLLSNEDWVRAGHAYAEERCKYFTVYNTVESWFERLLVETGPEADAHRAQALPLWRQDPSRRLDTFSSGPDHTIDEKMRRRFVGEE